MADTGDALLQFAQAFVKLRQQQAQMQQRAIASEAAAAERDRNFKIREQGLKLRQQALKAATEREQARTELADLDLQRKRFEFENKKKQAESAATKEKIHGLGDAINTRLSLVRVLTGRGQKSGDILAAFLAGGAAPKAERPDDEAEVQRLLSEIKTFTQQREELSIGGGAAPTLAPEVKPELPPPAQPNTLAPAAPASAAAPAGAQVEQATQLAQESALTRAAEVTQQIRGLQRQRLDPQFTGSRVEVLAQERALQEELQRIKASALNTVIGGP